MEKQQSFRLPMEKQRSFRLKMEKQQSFRLKKNRESAGKRGDKPLHLAARAGNLTQIKEILRNCDNGQIKELLSMQNHDGETAIYVATENGHAAVVSELLKFTDTQSAALKARNGYDAFHMAAKLGHLGKKFNPIHWFLLFFLSEI